MRRSSIIFVLIALSFTLNAQRVIRGRVVNEETGLPIPGSSVFITNTSKGTVSDGGGHFDLTDIPSGKHDLVISSIGYETIAYPFTDSDLPLQLKVQLKIKVKELSNVVVEPFVEEGWDKWGSTFTENFLGYTSNARKCRIKNREAIKFRYFKKSNRLIAFSDEPLQIENKALGYDITYQLEDFEVNFAQRTSVFMGYSLFTEADKDRKTWQKRRDLAYYGSLMHFIHSVFVDSIKENGFEVRRFKRIPNLEKERVRQLYRTSKQVQQHGSGITITTNVNGKFPGDSADYYTSVLRQPDYTDEYEKDLLTADSLLVSQDDPQHKMLYFLDYLHVTYKKELEDPDYVKAQMQFRKPTYQQSSLRLPEAKPVWIEKNGNYYNPRDMYFFGYWGWSDKLGDCLPLDFVPSK